MVTLKLKNSSANTNIKGVAKRIPSKGNKHSNKKRSHDSDNSDIYVPDTNTKGVAKRIPPKNDKRTSKKRPHDSNNSDFYVPEKRKRSGNPILANATSSFSATSTGRVHETEPYARVNTEFAGLDANGEIEFRSGNTPAGLFSPAEGESWDIPYTPEHVSKNDTDLTSTELPSERKNDIDLTSTDLPFERKNVTPERRSLDELFTPDAPHAALDKKVTTTFQSDYGENVPEWAQGDNYTGPTVTATVVKTFVPSYILQMPKAVRQRIYSFVLYPKGKAAAPRPFFSRLSKFSIPAPALLATCQQIREEATPLYYQPFIVTANEISHVLPWLKSLGSDSRAAIGKIQLLFNPWNHVHKTKEQQLQACLEELKRARMGMNRARIDITVKPNDIRRSLGGDLTDEDSQ